MRIPANILAALWLVLAAGVTLSPAANPVTPSAPVNAELSKLAAQAVQKSGWPPLRRYAESTTNPEQRGLAYFVLGYREFRASTFDAATADLKRSAETGFALADFAEYYDALAAQANGQMDVAAATLEGFPARHPASMWRDESVQALANLYQQGHQPQHVIDLLASDAETRRRPPLLLSLAEAYFESGQFQEAANAFQDLYFNFATSPASNTAGTFIAKLKTQLGPSFPARGEQAEASRTEALLHVGRAADALKGYDALLAEYPASPETASWKLARGRCLLRLKRNREMIDGLSAPLTPELDAERLALLARSYENLDDSASMLGALDQLSRLDPQSTSYATALSSAGYYFFRHGDWAASARYYATLAGQFPQTDLGREASWRLAWANQLLGENQKARQAILEYLERYPDSPRVPGALYWLGRLAEADGTLPEARGPYLLIGKRYPNTYYALQAAGRLQPKELGPAGRPGAAEPHVQLSGAASDAETTRLAAELAERIPPPKAAQVNLCASKTPPALQSFETLHGVSLDDLAEGYLQDKLADSPESLDLALILSRFQVSQKEYSAALFQTRKLVPDFAACGFPDLPKEIWNQLYPSVYWDLVRRQARANRLDPYLVMGLIRQESAFNPRATSVADARGLMQILPSTAATLAGRAARRPRPAFTREQLYTPVYNIRVSCLYLRDLMNMFNGNAEEVLAAYNAGDQRVREWLSRGPFSEPAAFVESIPFGVTRVYVESVLRDAVIYRRLLAGSPKFRRCPAVEPRWRPDSKTDKGGGRKPVK